MDIQEKDIFDHNPNVSSHGPYSRRPHRKTRTGCLSCKRRKIKCDELRPECEACVKHSLICEYPPTTMRSVNVPMNHITKLHKSISHPLSSTAPAGKQDSPELPTIIPVLNLLDMEFLHHFCTLTAHTSYQDVITRRVMSINVPQLGFSHDFVMHGILALAALHIAKLQPERREECVARAMDHHQSGLRKAALVLPGLNDSNASSLYIFTALTLLYTLASPALREEDDLILSGETGIAEWIVLSRQSFLIVEAAFDTLMAGPIGPIFGNGKRRSKLQDEHPETSGGNDYLRKVAGLINNNTPDIDRREAYARTLDELMKIYNVVEELVRNDQMLDTADIFIWPYKVTNTYLDLLQQPTQEALIILAFFAVLPMRYKNHWFLEDFSIHLISNIYPLIDEAHLSWIQWPLEQIGWIPS